ncbi:hypothetical protein CLOP_g18182 [Closterium sp. NIES-67]|nr:hypothetical protein CLOP_g18182 [Closterium sp. NIES-67]
MSSIYVLEPPTQGKVVVTTTLGDLDIELWPREAPKAVRNFVQLCLEGYYDNTIFHRIIPGFMVQARLCLEGYYDNTIFHRIIPGFMVQGGDPTGSGTGGESIYGEPFKDEFHSRLRFSHRGLVACANASAPHSNGSQWFFTLDRCDWLDKKHTIFGKITGDTIFNAVRLGEVDTDDNDRPFDPPSIISVEVIWNPFEDIVPRRLPATQQLEAAKKSKGRDKNKRRQQPQVKGTKQLNLLSFGEEAEEEEAQLEEANLRIRSSHDVLKDPRLLAETAEAVQLKLASRGGDSEGEEEEEESGRREGERLSRGRGNGREGDSAGGAIGSGRGRKGEEKGGKSGDRGGLGTLELLNRFKSKLTASKSVQQRETRADKDREDAADEGGGGGREEEREGERGGGGGSRRREPLESGKKREAGAYGPGGKARQDVGGEGEEEDAEEGGGVDWMAHRLKFEVKRNKRDEMLRNEDPDQYAVHDPLLEKGKEKFNKMQAKAKKRNREWAGRSLD